MQQKYLMFSACCFPALNVFLTVTKSVYNSQIKLHTSLLFAHWVSLNTCLCDHSTEGPNGAGLYHLVYAVGVAL